MVAECHSEDTYGCPIASVQQVDAVVQEFVRHMRRQMSFLQRWSPLDFTSWQMGFRDGYIQFEAFKDGRWRLHELGNHGHYCYVRNNCFRNNYGLMGEPSISICTLQAMIRRYMVKNGIPLP